MINQLSPILVRFSLPATHLADIRRYRPETLVVRARPAGGEESDGTLAFVDNAVDSGTGTILLKGAVRPTRTARSGPASSWR